MLSAGCAPSVTPLYRDFEPMAGEGLAEQDRLLEQLAVVAREAGWELAPSEASNVVTTTRRTISRGVLSKTTVSLDLIPLGGRHVRVLFHPRKEYVTGERTKVAYLDGSLRRRLLPPLHEALEEGGLVPVEDS
jgi:hypothetical protein